MTTSINKDPAIIKDRLLVDAPIPISYTSHECVSASSECGSVYSIV